MVPQRVWAMFAIWVCAVALVYWLWQRHKRNKS
jgi:cbb3-type cytochrome oxidase subunit 3